MEIEEQITRLRATYEREAAEYERKMAEINTMAGDPAVDALQFRRVVAEAGEAAARLAELRRMIRLLLHNGQKGRSEADWQPEDLSTPLDPPEALQPIRPNPDPTKIQP